MEPEVKGGLVGQQKTWLLLHSARSNHPLDIFPWNSCFCLPVFIDRRCNSNAVAAQDQKKVDICDDGKRTMCNTHESASAEGLMSRDGVVNVER